MIDPENPFVIALMAPACLVMPVYLARHAPELLDWYLGALGAGALGIIVYLAWLWERDR
ncbi:MAG: hypothetical protein IKH84_05955 [Ottowia sp.]|nr:hypothetical protein [Ottowia sp.]